MALVPTNVLDNPATPAISATLFIPDQLIAGPFQPVTHQATISGGAALPRGTVLGRVPTGTATAAAKSGGNTGNGTCTSLSVKGRARPGVYTARVVIAGTNAATINLYDPQGTLIDQKQLSGAAGTAVFANDHLAATITDGSTDFAVGDGFDITVAITGDKYVKAVATATDGSQTPAAVLADAADASGGDVLAGVYLTGEFNANAMTYDSSFASVAALQAACRPASIFVKSMPGSLSNADPS
ncbi:head decoration protein [uncultured Pseudacidovorax sp.]|uniref:head decoration protein n=1 Tax=uncultured Pseudacidovorax sp. TaxID=679313 RepID=UPI0025D23050|nr:head decoration protein [uncultured Pseudacidovorax sp.]